MVESLPVLFIGAGTVEKIPRAGQRRTGTATQCTVQHNFSDFECLDSRKSNLFHRTYVLVTSGPGILQVVGIRTTAAC